MRVVFLSHTPITSTFRVGSHHLSREVAALGHRVLHISTPLTLSHLAIAHRPDVRSRFGLATRCLIEDNVTHAVPFVPLPRGAGAHARSVSAEFLARWLAKKARATLGDDPDVVFVDQPEFAEALARLTAWTTVYRPTDIHVGSEQRKAEALILTRSSAVVATSNAVLASLDLPLRVAYSTAVIPNGVELSRFEVDVSENSQRSGAVYVGSLDSRFDWDAVRVIAANLPAGEVLSIFGPPINVPASLPPNTRVMGAIRYNDVPSILRQARIGLLPFGSGERSQGRSPMKLYEYLASGLFVVGSRTEDLKDHAPPGVELYSSLAELPDAVRRALSPKGANLEGQSLAQRQDWSVKAAQLLEVAAEARRRL